MDPTEIGEVFVTVTGGEVEAASSSTPIISEDDDANNNGNFSNTNTNSSFDSGNVNNVDDNIVCEILSRLPVNSLMQLKCMSKHWCSMIRKDRYLIDLHFNQSKAKPRLFITLPRDIDGYKRTEHDNMFYPISYFLVTADLLFEDGKLSPVVRSTREMDRPSCRITGPLNGLFYLFDPKKNHSIQVHNLSTDEFTPWIISTFISNLNVEDKNNLRIVKCDLGFDPATKEHKVICIWNIHHRQLCEVLTVGDGTWRVIDDVLPANNFRKWYLFGASIYVNGSVYYIPERLTGEDAEPKSILAFDVGKEKFRSIRIPDFILDQIMQKFQAHDSLQLLEIDGHPALLSRISDDVVKLWLFDNEYGSGYRTNTWTKVKIELPFHWGHVNYGNDVYSVRFHSVT